MNAPPPVTVGVPVRNGERFLARALDTIIGQTYTDFELLVSDNASTDATPDICSDYAARDGRIRFVRQRDNIGAAHNFNFVFLQARGRYFTWASHDDERAETNLARSVEVLQGGTESLVLVYPRAAFIDESGDIVGYNTDCLETRDHAVHRRLAHTLWQLNRVTSLNGLWRADALGRTRLIDRFVASDYVLLAEASLLGEIEEIPEVLFFRRLHERSSREANATNRAVLEWFTGSSANRRRPLLPTRARLMIEYHRSVSRLLPAPRERMLCHATIPRVVTARRVRVVGGRMKRQVREVMARGNGAS